MQKVLRIPRRFALTAAGIVALAAAFFVTATPASAGRLFTATISGPATVWDDYTCTWTATTDITDPDFEWIVFDGSTDVIVGTGPSVSYAFDRTLGAHQSMTVRAFNSSGDETTRHKLIGIYFYGVGDPDCP